MATLKQRKIALLEEAGLLYREAKVLAEKYTLQEMRKFPYIRNLLRNRRLLKAKAIKKGATLTQYTKAIKGLYARKKWVDSKGKMDFWAMLRHYRKEVQDSGGNPSPGVAPKKSHHGKGTSKGDVDGQRSRARFKEKTGTPAQGNVFKVLTKITELNEKIRGERSQEKKDEYIKERNSLWSQIA